MMREQSNSISQDELNTSDRGQTKSVVKTIRNSKDIEPPKRPIRESRPPTWYKYYMALMKELIDVEPFNFEQATQQQVWKDAMVEEYNSIMKE
jgi:hypothetical protein